MNKRTKKIDGDKITAVRRKCKTCGYLKDLNLYGKGVGWCYWLGRKRPGRSEECEDGYKEREVEYCVVATVNGVRKAIKGPMTKERAEAWCMMENEVPAYRRENKYPKVARYPYKSHRVI